MIIYKYKLEMLERQTRRIPSPQRFLSAQLQGNKICLWYEVNEHPSSDCYDDIEFMIVGTGYRSPNDALYLGTVQTGEFVWHVYARAV